MPLFSAARSLPSLWHRYKSYFLTVTWLLPSPPPTYLCFFLFKSHYATKTSFSLKFRHPWRNCFHNSHPHYRHYSQSLKPSAFPLPSRLHSCLPSRPALWSRMAKNPDVSTGSLAHPFVHSLVLLTHSLASHCLLRSRTPLRSLPCLKWMIRWLFFLCFFSALD